MASNHFVNECADGVKCSKLKFFLHREVFAQVPPKGIYTLTEKGESLRPLFSMLSQWGIEQVLEPRRKAENDFFFLKLRIKTKNMYQ